MLQRDYKFCHSNFSICFPNSMVLPFKWNLSGRTVSYSYLFLRILQNRNFFLWIFSLAAIRSERVDGSFSRFFIFLLCSQCTGFERCGSLFKDCYFPFIVKCLTMIDWFHLCWIMDWTRCQNTVIWHQVKNVSRFRYIAFFTWRHGGHICVPNQWNGGRIDIPNK